VLCAYKGLFRQRRYLGFYLDRDCKQIKQAEENWKEIDWSIFWQCRKDNIVPTKLCENYGVYTTDLKQCKIFMEKGIIEWKYESYDDIKKNISIVENKVFIRNNVRTYGAEHEFSDWDTSSVLPMGCKHNTKEYSIVNSDGKANDPMRIKNKYGGEINTPPTDNIEGQVEILKELCKINPNPTVNYRSNLHIHIMVPGLKDDIGNIIKLHKASQTLMPKLYPIFDPLPDNNFENEIHRKAFAKRLKRNKTSRHYVVPSKYNFDNANTLQELIDCCCPKDKKTGVPIPLFAVRPGLNVYQLKDTGTVEFRCFHGTLNPDELRMAFILCDKIIDCVLNNGNETSLIEWTKQNKDKFPKYIKFDYELDKGYFETCVKH
jgi:hypothetical protein